MRLGTSHFENTGDTMKRTIQSLLFVALALLVASPAAAYTGTYIPGAGINETPHDIPITTTGMAFEPNPNDNMERICIYCHAPHNAYKLSPANGGPAINVGAGPVAPDPFDYLPLWNHELTANYLLFNMYQNGPGAPQVGPKASQAIQNGMTPGSVSLLCLSCHDGSVAVNSYGNTAQPASSRSGGGLTLLGTEYLVGKDNYLGNHHPIGFDYDAVAAVDTEIRSADAATLGGAGLVREHLYGAGSSLMECATCHSVHNTGNTGERLLWRSDARSRLCLTCHAKGDNPTTVTP
jgi:predicted CXXCH cytochrome family protein